MISLASAWALLSAKKEEFCSTFATRGIIVEPYIQHAQICFGDRVLQDFDWISQFTNTSCNPHNFTVILGCRNEAKGKEAEEAIAASVPGSSVFFKKLDLSSFDSIQNFVKEICSYRWFYRKWTLVVGKQRRYRLGKEYPADKN